MFIGFFPVAASGTVPEIQSMQTITTPTMVEGDVLIYSSSLVTVAGANPTGLVGVALQAGDSAPGFNAANSPAVVTGREQKISVARFNRNTVFRAKLTNGSSVFVAPAITDVGISYGITAYTYGGLNTWTVDRAKTSGGGNHRVSVIDIDTINNFVFFKPLEAHLATP